MSSRTWTQLEITQLREYTQNNNFDWKEISELIKTKTPQQCSIRYHNIDKFGPTPLRTKTLWTEELDEMVLAGAEETERNWKLLSSNLSLPVSVIKNRFYVLQRKGFFVVKKQFPNLKLFVFDNI